VVEVAAEYPLDEIIAEGTDLRPRRLAQTPVAMAIHMLNIGKI
jgi:hypothetical protein